MTHNTSALALTLALWTCACRSSDQPASPTLGVEDELAPHAQEIITWTELFDGRSLGSWQPSAFGGQGEILIEEGDLILDRGGPLTGVTWSGEVERSGYELEVQAARLDGTDFFCGLTFPVGESCLTLILGGWGGALVGLSSIDGLDASHNDTCQYHDFVRGRFYTARIRVEAARCRVWLEDVLIIDEDLRGRRLGIRPEVEWSQPLGIASFTTTAAIRRIRLRKLATP